MVEHHDLVNNEVKVLLVEQGFHVCRKAKEVRLAVVQMPPLPALEMDCGAPTSMSYSAVPMGAEHCPATGAATATASAPRSVSRNIDVPKRSVTGLLLPVIVRFNYLLDPYIPLLSKNNVLKVVFNKRIKN